MEPQPLDSSLRPPNHVNYQNWILSSFLFRSDGSGFYLSLDLGTDRHYGTPSRAELGRLLERAEYLSENGVEA